MSLAVFEEQQKDIKRAYDDRNKVKIQKETINVLNFIIVVFQNEFYDRIHSITFDKDDLKFNDDYLFSEENREYLLRWIYQLFTLKHPINDEEFGKLKIDLENWYYKLGGKNIKFEYKENYLLTPGEVAELLGVSTVTVNKYVKQGLEYLDTRSHRKIPKHAVHLWKNPKYSILMQMIHQEKKLRNQDPKEQLSEVMQELLDFQIQYGVDSSQQADPIYLDYKRTRNLLSVLFPLKEHPVHGKTGLYAMERYDENGYVKKYSYQWKIIHPKHGKHLKHISAWENEPHDAEGTPGVFRVESEPHHHHHVPGDRNLRKENWDVWTLDDAFAFIREYIETGKEYNPQK